MTGRPLLILLVLAAIVGGCGSGRKSVSMQSSSSGGSGGNDVEPDAAPDDDVRNDTSVDERGSAEPLDLPARADGNDGVGVPDAPDANHVSEADHEACRGSCEVTASLHCAAQPPACVATCETELNKNPCPAELLALLSCQKASGPMAFTCDPISGANRLPGVCLAEVQALLSCYPPLEHTR